MASVNGITVKSLKTFEGREGTACQGNLYLNNKKIGFWSQDGDGAPDRFDLDSKYSEDKLIKALLKIRKENDSIMFMEVFMEKVINLIYDEKEYKKSLKQGYPVAMKLSDGYNQSLVSFRGPYEKMDNETLIKKAAPEIEKAKAQMFSDSDIEITIYRSPNDFIQGEPVQIKDIIRD